VIEREDVAMLDRSKTPYWGTVLDAPDAAALADFYSRLLGWPVVKKEDGWVTLAPPGSVVYLGFQSSEGYQPPTWPNTDGSPQMMLHLDLEVPDLERAVQAAVSEGATVADFQPQDDVRVMLDPAGHPFCLYVSD
jgi:catechol 2,3-dioxygenase-like lactoylglutathione lyase family enzyme